MRHARAADGFTGPEAGVPTGCAYSRAYWRRTVAHSITYEGLWWKPPLGPVRIPPTDRPVFSFQPRPAQMLVPSVSTAKVSISFNSSADKGDPASAATFSSNCATLDAPISAEVIRSSRSTQLSAS